MIRFQQIKPILSHVALNAPHLLNRGLHMMWERTGDFTDALDISKKRLLAVFLRQPISAMHDVSCAVQSICTENDKSCLWISTKRL